eukprot:m51a1_g11850 hypothetical protein (830) ;mRNA; r:485875-488973
MQFLRGVVGSFWGTTSAGQPKLTGGLFDMFNGKWRPLYATSTATIEPLSGSPHRYQVIIRRNEDEAEAEAESGDSDQLPPTFEFTVEDRAFFVAGKSPLGQQAIMWQLMQESGLSRLMFESDGTADEYTTFTKALCSALYEAQNAAPPPEGMEDADLLNLLAPDRKPPEGAVVKKAAPPAPIPISKFKPVVDMPVAPPPVPLQGQPGKTLERVSGMLFLFDTTVGTFALQREEITLAIQQDEVDKFKFYLCVTEEPEGKLSIYQPITDELYLHFDMEHMAVIWIYKLANNVWTWSVRLSNHEDDLRIKNCLAKCLYETNMRKPFAKVASEDQKFILATMRDKDELVSQMGFEEPSDLTEEDLREFEDMVLVEDDESPAPAETETGAESDAASAAAPAEQASAAPASPVHAAAAAPAPAPAAKPLARKAARESDSEESEQSDESSSEEESESEEEEEEDESSDGEWSDEDESVGGKNKLLSVAARHEHAYVVRGKQIGIFQATPSRDIKYRTKIKALPFSPRRIMLHDCEEKMVMLDPTDKKVMHHMDIETQKVVNMWKADDDYPVNEILPQDKYAQQESTQPFVGLNRVGFFLLDPRQDGNKIVDDRKFFSMGRTPPGFLCAATTKNGQIVVGTDKGEVRLYDHKLLTQPGPGGESRQPRAKTTYPGLGSPVIGIDVTGDGKWIVATCKTFLFVVPAVLGDGRSGFEKPLGKDKGIARRLQIKPNHVAMIGGSVSFTPAKFNTVAGGGDKERAIVTSTGEFLVTWNFNKVKENVLDQYQINQVSGTVVADQFRFGDADTVVVAMPDNVAIAKKSLPPSFRGSMAQPGRR